MIRSLAVGALFAQQIAMHAQCGMTVGLNTMIYCGIASVEANTTGGSAPYTIIVEKLPSLTVVETITNDADGDLNTLYDPTAWWLSDGCRVRVIDSQSCTAEATMPHAMFALPMHSVGVGLQCTTGLYRLYVYFNGFPAVCSIDGGPQIQPAGNWTFESLLNEHRYNGTLAPGSHNIYFPEVPGFCEQFVTFTIPPPITAGDCGVNRRLKAALGGALPSGSLMTDGLRAAGLIPAGEPYSALGYVYTGSPPNVSMAPGLLAVTGNNAIVDWVLVELRSAGIPTTILCSKPALIQRDGDVVDADGDAYVNFPVPAGSYRVALRHRNHLGIMTSYALGMGDDPGLSVVDFRSYGVAAYGTNAQRLTGSVWCMWPGDANFNGTAKYAGTSNDRDPILTAIGGTTPTNVVSNVYTPLDLNLDGQVKYAGSANDRDIILQTIGGSVPTATRVQQLP